MRFIVFFDPANVALDRELPYNVDNLQLIPWKVPLISMSNVPQLLNAIEQGDPHAADQLLPLVYDELRRLAAPSWHTSSRAKRCSRRRLSMKPICGWSAIKKTRTGMAAVISLPRPPRRCGVFSSKQPGGNGGASTAGPCNASSSSIRRRRNADDTTSRVR